MTFGLAHKYKHVLGLNMNLYAFIHSKDYQNRKESISMLNGKKGQWQWVWQNSPKA
jgi:hypothetical protein